MLLFRPDRSLTEPSRLVLMREIPVVRTSLKGVPDHLIESLPADAVDGELQPVAGLGVVVEELNHIVRDPEQRLAAADEG